MPRPARASHTLVAAVLATVLAPLAAQEYRSEKIQDCGVEITISNRLKRLPLRLDSWDVYLRARFRPEDEKDYVQTREGPYAWYTDVYEFKTAVAAVTPGRTEEGGAKEGEGKGEGEGEGEGQGEGEGPEGGPSKDPKKLMEEMLKKLQERAAQNPKTFAKWLEDQEPVRIVTKGKEHKARGGRLPYKLWEWQSEDGTRLPWYNGAAVYEFDGREVALVVSMPLNKGAKPTGKFAKFCRTTLASGRECTGDDDGIDESEAKDKYADSEPKQKALDAAKKNIASLRDWDYFTSPNYIVLYSWDKSRAESYRMSKRLAGLLEKMRTLYTEYYPSRQDQENPYSVFRVCATYEQFRKYGESPYGVVGWFSPTSKELVVFQGGDKMMGKGATDAVTFHEGWHQYCDAYFDGVEVHRWFDEGHGDFFGAHEYRGKWNYVGSAMRYEDVKNMVKVGDFQRFKTITSWPRDKFYSGRSPYYYAQAYSMIDFLRRGDAMGKKFDPSWSKILDKYRRTVLEKKDAEIAVKEAFDGVDWDAMEAAWKEWVDSPHFRKG